MARSLNVRARMAIDVNDFDIDIAEPVEENLAESERWASMIGGGALILYGLSKKSFGGLLLAALGGGLVYRGKTAHCPVYQRLGISTKTMTGMELELEASTTIYRSPEEVYRFYRDFDNLPRFMKHLESVTPLGGGRSRWVMNVGPKRLEWDAQIVEEREYELIRWRSLEGADIQHHGQVRFERAPGERGTEVHVSWHYLPPGAVAGALIGKLAQIYTSTTLKEELYRMKQILEAGEIATTEGQPSGKDQLAPAELLSSNVEPDTVPGVQAKRAAPEGGGVGSEDLLRAYPEKTEGAWADQIEGHVLDHAEYIERAQGERDDEQRALDEQHTLH